MKSKTILEKVELISLFLFGTTFAALPIMGYLGYIGLGFVLLLTFLIFWAFMWAFNEEIEKRNEQPKY